MIIAVSDVHLGDSHSNENGFISFIQEFLKPNQREISNLVLMGDILDFWGKNTTVVMRNYSHIFNALVSFDFETHYLVGNHDFALSDPRVVFSEDISVAKNLSLTDGKNKLRFIHGHQLSYWYALTFYELFSHAMCFVTEDDDTSAVWSVLLSNLPEVHSFVAERVDSLSLERKKQIENKLAGPLIGQEYMIEETFIREHNLLNRFMDFKSFQTKNAKLLLKEIETLSTDMSSLSHGELSNDALPNSPLSKIAQGYLTYWLQICEWSRVNDKSATFEKVLGHMRRIASMFSIGLNPDEFLIHGHGHTMMIDQDNRIADAGCWISDSGSYVSISDGNVSCSRWPKR